ncbi:MAG: RsmE family RNA methyltransferase [Phycisphaerae bacterium]
MRTCRLYCPDLQLGEVVLPAVEAHHATTALRLGVGDAVHLFDGKGRHAAGVVAHAKRDTLRASVAKIHEASGYDVPWRLMLAVAFPKAHRQGYLVEKCTELGVAAIWPLISERTVAKPGPRTLDRWRRRAVEAAKQSQRYWIPAIEPPATVQQAIQRGQTNARRAFADTGAGGATFSEFLSNDANRPDILVLIGPEGGWTDLEKEELRRGGYGSVTLGPTILRTETAAVAVCAAMGALAKTEWDGR